MVISDPSPPQKEESGSASSSFSSSSELFEEGSAASCRGSASATLDCNLVELGSEDLFANLAAGTAMTMTTVSLNQHFTMQDSVETLTDCCYSANNVPLITGPNGPNLGIGAWSVRRVELFSLFILIRRMYAILLQIKSQFPA